MKYEVTIHSDVDLNHYLTESAEVKALKETIKKLESEKAVMFREHHQLLEISLNDLKTINRQTAELKRIKSVLAELIKE